MQRSILFLLFSTLLLITPTLAHAKEPTMRMYIGTYTGPNSQGIYRVDLDSTTGALGEPVLAGEAKNPSFLALSPDNRFLYAVAEIGEFNGQKTGAVASFAVDPATGKLSALNAQSSTGAGPCFVAVDPSGKAVLVANYSSGTVGLLPIAGDGSLLPPSATEQHTGSGPNPKRQQKAFAHSISPDPSGKFALSCDLGTDEVIVYKLDASAGTLVRHSVIKLAPGTGPRHLAFHPSGTFVFVNGELTNDVTALKWDVNTGTLATGMTVSTLPPDFHDPSTTAEVAVHPNGKFVYVSNRGHDSIAVLSFDEGSGALATVDFTPTQGKQPRNFSLDPTGAFLVAANQKSDSLVSFKVDPTSGKLTSTGSKVQVGAACCVRFVKP